MCWTTQASLPTSLSSSAYWTSRSNTRLRVRTRSTGVISSSRVRIGLICSAEPIQARAAPIRPPLRRYSSVSIANHIRSRSRVSRHPLDDLLGRLPGVDRGRRRQDEHPHPAASRAAVDDVDPFTAATLVDQPLPRLQSRFVGAGDPGGEVDRDDRPTRFQQRPVDVDEVADRRLRGRRSRVARPEPLEERCRSPRSRSSLRCSPPSETYRLTCWTPRSFRRPREGRTSCRRRSRYPPGDSPRTVVSRARSAGWRLTTIPGDGQDPRDRRDRPARLASGPRARGAGR